MELLLDLITALGLFVGFVVVWSIVSVPCSAFVFCLFSFQCSFTLKSIGRNTHTKTEQQRTAHTHNDLYWKYYTIDSIGSCGCSIVGPESFMARVGDYIESITLYIGIHCTLFNLRSKRTFVLITKSIGLRSFENGSKGIPVDDMYCLYRWYVYDCIDWQRGRIWTGKMTGKRAQTREKEHPKHARGPTTNNTSTTIWTCA